MAYCSLRLWEDTVPAEPEGNPSNKTRRHCLQKLCPWPLIQSNLAFLIQVVIALKLQY